MARRRGKGEGSIYKRKSDGRWVGSLSLGKGRRKEYYGKTRKEVADMLRTAQADIERGTFTADKDTPVGVYLDHWLENVHRSQLRIGSYRNYRYALDSQLIPAFGSYTLQKLTPQHLEVQYATWRADGLDNATIGRWHAILHAALKKAVSWGLIGFNVCDRVSPGKITKKEHVTLTAEQAHTLLAAAEPHGLKPMLLVLVTLGLRRGEMCGLRWSDIDFAKKTLSVSRTAAYIPHHGLVINEPKTAKGRRVLPLPDVVADALRLHLAHQRDDKHETWNPTMLVFPDPAGNVWHDSRLQVRWKRVLQEAGLPDMRLHDLRHSAATILLQAGVSLPVVQDILGHSSISITADIYGHLGVESKRGAAVEMERLFHTKTGEEQG